MAFFYEEFVGSTILDYIFILFRYVDGLTKFDLWIDSDLKTLVILNSQIGKRIYPCLIWCIPFVSVYLLSNISRKLEIELNVQLFHCFFKDKKINLKRNTKHKQFLNNI